MIDFDVSDFFCQAGLAWVLEKKCSWFKAIGIID
jgi:hypothetical protein